MNMNPLVHNQEIMAKTMPSERYAGEEDFFAWQKRGRAILSGLLGLQNFEICDECFNIESQAECEEYKEYRFTVQSEANYYVPMVLRLPIGKKEKYPLMLCLQGHSTGMHISLGEIKYPKDESLISGGDRDFAKRAIEEGYAALCIEQRCFGACGSQPDGSPDCERSSLAALMLGRTTIGERVWDVSRAIDAVEAHFADLIDCDKIYLMGNSGGGTATYYAACIDERIRCAMPSCAVCSWAESITAVYHCTCNYIPGIARYFDMGDLGGLIAPRGLVVVNGALDSIFRKVGVEESFEITKRLYAAAGAPDACAHVEGPEGHRFYADLAWPVFKEIVERLK